MAKKAKRVKSRKTAKRSTKRVKSRKVAEAGASVGYKGHRKGSLAEKLHKVYDEKGVDEARAAAKRMEARGEIASHTYRSFFSLWGRKIVPGSGKPRGRKRPIKRVKSRKAAGTTGRVKSKNVGKKKVVKAAKKKAPKAAKRAAKKAAPKRVTSRKAAPAPAAAPAEAVAS